MRDVYLRPGECAFGGPDLRIRTHLGSCVSITMWQPLRRKGGMCHYLLGPRSGERVRPFSGKYADEALLLLLREALATRESLASFHAGIFGGGSMFEGGEGVCEGNIEAARRLVRQLGLTVVAEDVGGTLRRSLVFDTGTGLVQVGRAHGMGNGGGS